MKLYRFDEESRKWKLEGNVVLYGDNLEKWKAEIQKFICEYNLNQAFGCFVFTKMDEEGTFLRMFSGLSKRPDRNLVLAVWTMVAGNNFYRPESSDKRREKLELRSLSTEKLHPFNRDVLSEGHDTFLDDPLCLFFDGTIPF